MSPADQTTLSLLLQKELDRLGFGQTPVAASDESQYFAALKVWQSLNPDVKAMVGQVKVHGYQCVKGPRAELRQATADMRLWNTEYGDDKAAGLETARCIGLDLQLLRPAAWCYWQPLVSSAGWAMIRSDLAAKTIGTINPKFFVLAQFTRHIRPGRTILATGDPAVIAAFDPKSSKLVLVTVNVGAARPATFDLSAFKSVSGPVYLPMTEPNANSLYQAPLGTETARPAAADGAGRKFRSDPRNRRSCCAENYAIRAGASITVRAKVAGASQVPSANGERHTANARCFE